MAATRYVGIVPVRNRGVITLPAELRRRLHLDVDGASVEVVEREDGVVELRPSVVVPANQAWFWSERWQRMEREADDDISSGRLTSLDTLEKFLENLDDQPPGK